jgi:hypothetical protein
VSGQGQDLLSCSWLLASPLFEWAVHAAVAVAAFLIITAVAVLLHASAHGLRLRHWLPSPFIRLINFVASVLFLMDVVGFLFIVFPPFWALIPPELQALIRHLVGLPIAIPGR